MMSWSHQNVRMARHGPCVASHAASCHAILLVPAPLCAVAAEQVTHQFWQPMGHLRSLNCSYTSSAETPVHY
mgnify:CR=1 FL=1